MDETATIQVSFNNRSIHNCIIKGKPAKRWNELMRIKNMIPKERHEEYIKKNPEIKHMLPKGCLCNETCIVAVSSIIFYILYFIFYILYFIFYIIYSFFFHNLY